MMLKLKKLMKKSAEAFAELVFPSNIYCMGCETEIGRDELYSLCDECLQNVRWANGKTCSVCGKPLEDWYPDERCSECRNITRAFDRGIACFQYGETERKMIKRFKYRGRSYMARKFADIIYDRLDSVNIECDMIIAVPMHRRKERERGYNQAHLLAEFTAAKLGVRCDRGILMRVRDTEPMNKLGARARRMNLRGAFELTDYGREAVKGLRILLVDDIFTTGATADMCSVLLKEAGASEVIMLCLAAGRNQREIKTPAAR